MAQEVSIRNAGSEFIPAWGVVLAANSFQYRGNPNVLIDCYSPQKGGRMDEGTFNSIYHYHNRVGINSGRSLRSGSHGHAIFDISRPLVAATNEDELMGEDILVASSRSSVLERLIRGEPDDSGSDDPELSTEIIGDYRGIFAIFRPLRRIARMKYLVNHVKNPSFYCKATADGNARSPAVVEILQVKDSEAGELSQALSVPQYLTVYTEDKLKKGDKFFVALMAGALTRIGGSGGPEEDDDKEEECLTCRSRVDGSTVVLPNGVKAMRKYTVKTPIQGLSVDLEWTYEDDVYVPNSPEMDCGEEEE